MDEKTICRTPKPSPANIKKAIEWAKNDPSVDKAAYLIILQTGNYATRKGFDEPFHQALASCTQEDQKPLWEIVEGDWDAYRVLHAMRALADIGGELSIRRLIDLGRTEILRIHWALIEKAAKESGIEIPADITGAQKEMDSRRGNSDFYSYFEARRPSWDPERDQLKSEDQNIVSNKKLAGEEMMNFPKAFLPDGEQNRFLMKYKSSLKKTLTNMEGLFEEVDLAFYLTAIDRVDEALEVLGFLTSRINFDGNYNIWTPVGFGICLQGRLYRMKGDSLAADEAFERIETHPLRKGLPQKAIEEEIKRFPAELDKGFSEKSQKWSCHLLSRTLMKICYHCEILSNDLEDQMTDGLQKLRARLEGS